MSRMSELSGCIADLKAAAAALRSAIQPDSSLMRDIRDSSFQKLTLVFVNAIVHDFHLRSGAVAS